MPEELKNITTNINLDSETARVIAEQYITYKYFDTICILVFIIAAGLLIKWVITHVTKE
jgi:hypothetical protein